MSEPDFKSFWVRETRMGEVRLAYVMEPWPDYVLLSPELAEMYEADDGIRFAFTNGNARYKKIGEDRLGNWECHLISSQFEAPPPNGLH